MKFAIITDQENLPQAQIYAQKYTMPIVTETDDLDKMQKEQKDEADAKL